MPYLEQFYNIQGFFKKSLNVYGNSTACILNSIIEALNEDDRLPRFLIIALDKDILSDFHRFDHGISKNIEAVINWLTCQIEIAVRRKNSQIAEKKPGAIGTESDPTVIYINMIQQPLRKWEFNTNLWDILEL